MCVGFSYNTRMTIGFVGQGFIGKHLADDFENRGYQTVRYALEPAYIKNKELITTCDVVFIAVPTATTPTGFDLSIIEEALSIIGDGKIAVIKSTLLPGTTINLQNRFTRITILNSPEFLREKTAKEDTEAPLRNIIGIPVDDEAHLAAAQMVMSILPASPFAKICHASEAELIKYGGNCFLAIKVVFMNMICDVANQLGVNYENVAEAMKADPRIGTSHMSVIDKSGHPGSVPGRGAGGHCFPKDLAAFRAWYQTFLGFDQLGLEVLKTIESKNNSLLRESKKDLDILQGIYGH